MKKPAIVLCVLALAAVFAAPHLLLGGPAKGEGVQIVISPHALVIKSPGTVVTVHTNLGYYTVDHGSLELNGIPVSWTKIDSCGDLVAKFDMNAVKEIVNPPSATLTLTGCLKDGTEFAASDTIVVR